MIIILDHFCFIILFTFFLFESKLKKIVNHLSQALTDSWFPLDSWNPKSSVSSEESCWLGDKRNFRRSCRRIGIIHGRIWQSYSKRHRWLQNRRDRFFSTYFRMFSNRRSSWITYSSRVTIIRCSWSSRFTMSFMEVKTSQWTCEMRMPVISSTRRWAIFQTTLRLRWCDCEG